MARGITEADVFEAADQLLVRGERPTIERVRQQLGTGSPNTVNRLLDLWWASLAKRMAGKAQAPLPASLTELCQRLYDGIRLEVSREAGVEANALRFSLEQRRQVLERDRQDLIQEKQSISTMIDALRADLAAASAQNAESAAQAAILQASLITERNGRLEAESLVQKLKAADAQVRSAAEQQVERIRVQLEGNERRWLLEIDRLRTQAKQSAAADERSRRSFENRIGALSQAAAEKDAELRQLRTDLKKSERELAAEQRLRAAAVAELQGMKRLLPKTANRRPQKPSSKG